MRSLDAFFRLPRAEKALCVRAWVWLLVVTPALRVLPFRWLDRVLGGTVPRRAADALATERVVYLLDAAARRSPWAVSCLPRSLVLRRLLAAEGHAAVLCIGVQKSAAGLDAHAWVEIAGEAVGEPGDLLERFARLERTRLAC